MNQPFGQADHVFVATVRKDVFQAAGIKGRLLGMSPNQAIEQALIAWCGLDRPLPIPVPFQITIVKE